MKRKVLLVPAAVAMTLLCAYLPAYAHIPSHSATCDGITASGTKYTAGGTVDLTIGTAHSHRTFTGPNFSYSLGNPDKTKPESWSIVIVSNAKDGSASYEGSIAACQTTTTVTGSSIPAATSTTQATTTTTKPSVSTTSTPSSTVPSTTTSTTVYIGVPSTSSTPTTTVPVSSTSSSTPAASSSTTPTTPPPNSETGTPPILSQRSNGSPPPSLPATGVDVSAQLYGAGVLLLVGFVLICVTRRKRLSVKS